MGKTDKKSKKKSQKEINIENIRAGLALIDNHPLWGRCYYSSRIVGKQIIGNSSMGICESDGYILLNEDITLSPRQWAYVIAHCILHLAFGHFDADKMPGYTVTDANGNKVQKIDVNPLLWNMACDIYADKFLEDIKFGQSIHDKVESLGLNSYSDEITIYNQLLEKGISATSNHYGTASVAISDMKGLENPLVYEQGSVNRYTTKFSYALAYSVSNAVSIAGGHTEASARNTPGQIAAGWFIDRYPFLGGLASHFKIIEDYTYCNKNDIHIAAVDVTANEIYLNPSAGLTYEELKFVLAHEYLHAGLMHHDRCNGRDPYLWNVACDYVINGWLHELQIGVMPSDGLLYNPELAGLSAESIYDMMVSELKKYSKLSTFRGFRKGDIIGEVHNGYKDGMVLDDFCRSALSQGLEYHISTGRGFIPAGLIEEIRALAMPPIPWDVALAKWFDTYFAPLEKRRSYARPSRRQASTPDIPRPNYMPYDIPIDSRTFGVVIDTSGSMDARTVGKALGSIASYSVAHDVPFARVVFCDADAYDAGYISPEDIAGKVLVKGRGGTCLQPGINALENAEDFPKDGPILIITDGEIESHLDITHKHAYLLPKGKRLPFKAKGNLFYFE